MGQFRVVITGIGPNGCDRTAETGQKLHHRCQKLVCPDCRTYDFVQQMRQLGFTLAQADFIHHPGTQIEVTDSMIKNERTAGKF